MNIKYMERALYLAKKGEGYVSPNPLVGAVIVKDGRIIGEGYHRELGADHAEVAAFKNCSTDPRGGSLYVNLEPCSHYGRTPPCVDMILKKGISKVYIGILDPNPRVGGRGIERLRKNGVSVQLGILEEECREINKVFLNYILKPRPYMVLKAGTSLDGKIATRTGESKWITGEESREDVHRLRNKYMGIMVGIGTVIKDNPRLTCRLDGGVDPVRIILDSRLRLPLESRILENPKGKVIIGYEEGFGGRKKEVLEGLGVRLIGLKRTSLGLDVEDFLLKLKQIGIDSILVEGGSRLNYSLVSGGLIDEINLYMSGKIIGGDQAKSFIGGEGIGSLKESFNFNHIRVKPMGEDILILARERVE